MLQLSYHFQQAVVWRNCSTADTIFFMVVINPLDSCHEHRYCSRGIRSARDYMLQIEDIRRSERNALLPIPISPCAIVKNRRVLDLSPERSQASRNSPIAAKFRLVRSASEWAGSTSRQGFPGFAAEDPVKPSIGTTPSVPHEHHESNPVTRIRLIAGLP